MTQHTPAYPDQDTFELAFKRAIIAAMTGDREGIDRATQEVHTVTAPYITREP